MDGTDKIYLIGELAAATGVTVRTLQHYDNIGLLPTSGRTDGGRRYYTKEDILCLEQIIFYKSLGFSLQEIRDKVVKGPKLSQTEQILHEQEVVLYRKIEDAYASIASIEAFRTAVAAGNFPSWQLLTGFIRTLRNSNLLDWGQYTFDDAQKEMLGNHFAKKEAFDFYHTWRAIALKAVTLAMSGVAPKDPVAQELAEAWWKMVLEVTKGDDERIHAFAQIQEDRASWPEGDRDLMDASQSFIDLSVKHYLKSRPKDSKEYSSLKRKYDKSLKSEEIH
ncbi:MerR family transcriptional regulator [Paenibacillus spongiae]|uniref:MerR family transcriptional regulator n=1 Tax=Paenibacillus spongiae TaxID=2909671 RepID=A0ABY5S9I9_9BACL|nr:MerR family transcriptional regulator [Paenibacillus spongiae]UVI29205.1 MerR family transcriptional regulator [Paenibacillus spongiae]